MNELESEIERLQNIIVDQEKVIKNQEDLILDAYDKCPNCELLVLKTDLCEVADAKVCASCVINGYGK